MGVHTSHSPQPTQVCVDLPCTHTHTHSYKLHTQHAHMHTCTHAHTNLHRCNAVDEEMLEQFRVKERAVADAHARIKTVRERMHKYQYCAPDA